MKRGPKLGPGGKRSTYLNIRIRPSDHERWKLAAQESGLTLSEFTRRTLDYLIVFWSHTQEISNSGGRNGANRSEKLADLLAKLFPSKRI